MNFFRFIRKHLYFLFQFYYKCFCMPTNLSVKITTKIFKFYLSYMNFHNFIRNVIQKSSILSENTSTYFFKYILIVFVCLSLFLIFLPLKLQFYQLSYVILNLIIHMFVESLQFYTKMSQPQFSIIF